MSSIVRRLAGRKSRTRADATADSFSDLRYTDPHRVANLTGCKMCWQLWDFVLGRLIDNSTLNIKLNGEYLGSTAAMSCSLCSVISHAVENAIHDSRVESISLHTSSVGGPLDMVTWLADGNTRSFELYTHPGK